MFTISRAPYLLALTLGIALAASPLASVAQISLSITIAPPPLPVYEQPPMVEDGDIWTPGYWSYGPDGYFWVPGTWVQAPEAGLLWTPGYWGWNDGFFVFNAGYWGPHIGFYGGVNYGFGYTGHGYEGGYWRDRQFFYNQSVNNVNVTVVHNVYTKTVINNVTVNNVSFNGGNGGVSAQPTREEDSAAREPHRAPTAPQVQHHEMASSNHALLASVNQGKPEIAATQKPADFSGRGVVKASRTGAPGGAPVTRELTTQPAAMAPAAKAPAAMAPAATPPARPAPMVHASELPKAMPRTPVPSGDAARDEANQREQAILQSRHDQERQALQQKQDQEHAQVAQQKAGQPQAQQLEQQHQQQTQQLQQRHATEQQKLQQTQETQQRRAPEQPKDNRRPNN